MSSTLFTTSDGDVILRAGTDPDSKHAFRVHKFILSLASPVFKDMFTLPQPPDQSEEHQLPVVDVSDPPKSLDMLLRLIYPGVEPPEIPDIPTLTALLSAADKYNITSIYPTLRGALETFSSRYPFRAYVVACRFGFPEEARAAARVGTTKSIISEGIDEEVQHISSIDVLRWVKFVQEREREGLSLIGESLDWWQVSTESSCVHRDDGRDFYFRLEKAVEEAFCSNPCVGSDGLFAILNKVPDPPLGCKSLPDSGEFCYDACVKDAFKCLFQPMTIRNNLVGVAEELGKLNYKMLDEAFKKEIGSG